MRDCCFLLLLSWCSILAYVDGSLPDDLTKVHYTEAHRALHRLVKRTSHSHLEDFEIVVPEIFDMTFRRHGNRRRRDIFHNSPDHQTVKFFSHGRDFYMELTPNTRLVTRDFSVDRISKGTISKGSRAEDALNPDLRCHRVGSLLPHRNGTAALSTCGGLSGLIRTEEDDFLIEPAPRHVAHDFPDHEQPHIVYKRRHLSRGDDKVNICGKQKRNPIPISVNDISEIKELSNGEMIVVKHHKKTSGNRTMREDPQPRPRPKRDEPSRKRINQRRAVETLVVVDRHLIEKNLWQISQVATYVLTVMNMMSALYRDSSLDEKVDIALVGLILLEDDQELHLDHRADKSLTNFCRWQARLNTTSGRRPDHAILLTGKDICIDKNEPCDTLGLAQIGGMCSTTESCTINEDTGLGVAFTIAHETGHSFGMKHDGKDNSCGKRDGHIMSPTLNTVNGVFTWSACSRKTMAKFLRSDRSRCLDNEPSFANVTFPEGVPGQRYNATIQCQFQYGLTADLCHNSYIFDLEPVCKTLFCRVNVNGLCKTKHMPAAEGTTCGKGKWCRRGVCVPRGSPGPKPVDGGWSRFGPWSECSRTCGRGVSFRRRFCNHPIPMYGGRYCGGEEKIYQICNSFKCPLDDKTTYRARQCAKYNSQPYRRQYFEWIPFTKYWKYDFNRCELFCEANGYGFFDRLSSQVMDGTSCDDESDDVCIEGQCVHVGCDLVINSNATVDVCGVCNGDNSTCRFVTGSFRRRVYDSGYYHLVKIPQGARNIRIWEERCCTHTYIAARSAVNSSSYFLNGNWRVNLYGEWRFGGAKWKYERRNSKGEELFSKGPLETDIVIEVLIVRRNPGVSFTYAMKEIDNTLAHDGPDNLPRHSYAWNETFSPCSRSCGGGVQRSTSECVEDGQYAVNDSYCLRVSRPELATRKCNNNFCPARWAADEWQQCSRTCGGGVQLRKVSCLRDGDNKGESVAPKHCRHARKPSRSRLCPRNDCPPEWKGTRWTKCSKTCGRGFRSRTMFCKSGIKRLSHDNCDQESKPVSRQLCVLSYCGIRFRWALGDWDTCSVTCGEGRQYRTMKCAYRGSAGRLRPVHYRRCEANRKPKVALHKSCSMGACPTASAAAERSTSAQMVKRLPKSDKREGKASRRIESRQHQMAIWVSSDWQACTVSCGGGQQVRAVKCMRGGKPSVACLYGNKLPNIRVCNAQRCPGSASSADSCTDKHSWCHLVPQHNTCSHIYFGKQCCQSCKRRANSRSG